MAAYWSSFEFYWEGWGLPYPEPLAYLVPVTLACVLGLVAVTWPRLGGRILSVGGGGVGVAVAALAISRGMAANAVVYDPSSPGWPSFFAAISAYWLPIVLNRYDDGRRDAAVIQIPEAALQWAPAGPGWNWRQDFGGYPSWSSLALYGVEPVGLDDKVSADATMDDMATTGLCGYLTEDGTELAQEWIGKWRMPSTSEVVSCLVSDGETAGCSYDPATRHSDCETRPDKETPLWAPDQPPIYVWTLDQATSPGEADYVGYNGTVRSQAIDFANPRDGYRCVRTLQPTGG